MNTLTVIHKGKEPKLALTVWDEDTNQLIIEDRQVLDLFGSEVDLKGGRFARFNPEARNHFVLRPWREDTVKRTCKRYIEWIVENIVGDWYLEVQDERDSVSHWGQHAVTLQFKFLFEELEDAVLFKLRWV